VRATATRPPESVVRPAGVRSVPTTRLARPAALLAGFAALLASPAALLAGFAAPPARPATLLAGIAALLARPATLLARLAGRLAGLVFLLAPVFLSAPAAGDAGSESMARGARALWALQGADGGWHSETYGLLRSGQSLTPFVLGPLLEVPEEIEPARPEAARRAICFVLGGIDAEGALGRLDPMIADYPNYASALGAVVLARAGEADAAARIRAWLLGQQLADALGWKPEDAAYGAWGMGGPPCRAPQTGRVDLSFTRHVLEALRACGVGAEDPALAKAARFVARCGNPDGGFFLSPVHEEINKAGLEQGKPRSYGTATADGALALLALGVAPEDPRLRAATRWLVEHHRADRVPGIPSDDDAGWAEAMHFYYLAASARALRALAVDQAPAGRDWRVDLVAELARRQRPDGTWCSANFLMKEDDPLVATALALRALLAAR